jgi:hypothetical protein
MLRRSLNSLETSSERKAKVTIPIALKPEQLAQQLSEMGYDTRVLNVRR